MRFVAIRNTRLVAVIAAALFASMGAAGCRGAPSSPVHAQSGDDQSSTKRQAAALLKTLTLSHPGTTQPVIGSEVDAIAEGLPPGRKVDLMWQTVNGGWVVEDY